MTETRGHDSRRRWGVIGHAARVGETQNQDLGSQRLEMDRRPHGVRSDMKATGRSREDGQAEADAETTQEGSDRGREGQRGKRGNGDQAQEWKDFWQRTEEKERGK